MSTKTDDHNTWVWVCITDPTRSERDPGDFYNGRFRIMDLRTSANEQVWPEGITFQHIKTGEALQVQQGRLVSV